MRKPSPTPEFRYLTSVGVARRLDVVPDRVRQLARAGRLLPAIVTESGVRLYTVDEVERYRREEATRRPVADAPSTEPGQVA